MNLHISLIPLYYLSGLSDLEMEIKTITYKRTNNLGNYCSESLEMTAELEQGDSPLEAAADLQEKVLISLGLKKPSSGIPEDLNSEDTFSF